MAKLFSIITPTYNCASKLEGTIQSVMSQDQSLFEYIIVDGASNDNTLSVIEKYRAGLLLTSEPDNGIYDAMNKGIQIATGKYVLFLGAGDRLRENALTQISKALPADGLHLVYGNVYWVSRGANYGWEFTKRDLVSQNICQQAIAYSRKIFELFGGFETKYKTLGDYAFNLKCFGNHSISKQYLNCVVSDYEGGGTSEQVPDEAFISDFNWLILTRLGSKAWFRYVIAPRVAGSRIVRPFWSFVRSVTCIQWGGHSL